MSMNLNLSQMGSKSAYTVSVGNLTLFFSYSTCVAFNYCDPISGEQICGRDEHKYSVTTSAHMNALGCGRYPAMSNDELQNRVHNCLVDMSITSQLRAPDPASLDFTRTHHYLAGA